MVGSYKVDVLARKLCRFDGLPCEIVGSCDGILSYGVGKALFLDCSRIFVKKPICFYDGLVCKFSFSCLADLARCVSVRCGRYRFVKKVEVVAV